tara:strand:+ start:425 stop:604 length:180 start_codon:yes stop_codon:yes gene_type:complete
LCCRIRVSALGYTGIAATPLLSAGFMGEAYAAPHTCLKTLFAGTGSLHKRQQRLPLLVV